jgi:hypothetical protein
MKKLSFLTLVLAMLVLPLAARAANVLVVPPEVPFAAQDVPDAVKAECNVPTKISDFIQEYSKGVFDKVEVGKSDDKDAKVLEAKVVDIEGRGGGAWSGTKFITVEGTLKQGGKTIGTFRAKRYSGGGAFAGYKGTCSILGRCTKAIGKDIALWAANPTMDARLGDL